MHNGLLSLQDKSTVFNFMLGEQTHVACTQMKDSKKYND
jgi:hypothetical protein